MIDRYDRTACEHCHGLPPAGFSCVWCLSYGQLEGEKPYSPLEGRFDEIELGDTTELDPGWDRFVECMDYLTLARAGMPPILISRLFRVAVDGYKESLGAPSPYRSIPVTMLDDRLQKAVEDVEAGKAQPRPDRTRIK